MVLPVALAPVVTQVLRTGVTAASKRYGPKLLKQAKDAYKKETGKPLRKGGAGGVKTPKDDTASMVAKDVGRKTRQRVATTSKPAPKGPRGLAKRGAQSGATTAGAEGALDAGKKIVGLSPLGKAAAAGTVGAAAVGAAATKKDGKDKPKAIGRMKTKRPTKVDDKAKPEAAKKTPTGRMKQRKKTTPTTATPTKTTAPTVKPPKAGGDYEKYKSIAAAKKAGSLYYDKDGEKMAAVYKEDLEPGQILRDYMNEKLGLTRRKDPEGKKGGGMMKTKGYAMGGLKKPTTDQKGLKKLPTEVRNKMGYMKGGGMMKTKGYAKGGMKKMMGGGMAMGMDPRKKRKDMMGLGAAASPMMKGGGMMKTKMNTKGGMKGGGMMKTKGYAKGSTVKTKGGVRGAGIARKGVRKAKML